MGQDVNEMHIGCEESEIKVKELFLENEVLSAENISKFLTQFGIFHKDFTN
jgi:hypothetical protein